MPKAIRRGGHRHPDRCQGSVRSGAWGLECAMDTFEIIILVVVFVGFLGLIAYAARHARSGDE